MKTIVKFQNNGKELDLKDVESSIVDRMKKEGYKKKDLNNLNLFYNGNEGEMYYSVDLVSGNTISGKL